VFMALDFFSNYEFYTASLLLIYSNHIIDSLVKNLNVGLGCMHVFAYSSLMIMKEVEDRTSDNRLTFRQLYYYSYFIF
jgi:hypothetical protein